MKILVLGLIQIMYLDLFILLFYYGLQQIKALLESVGTSFCPNYLDWFGDEVSDGHSRNADRSVVSKFLQARPADSSTTRLQVGCFCLIKALEFLVLNFIFA